LVLRGAKAPKKNKRRVKREKGKAHPLKTQNWYSSLPASTGDEANVLGAKIRVVGLGGAGNNAINRMIENGLEGVEFIAGNTDAQVLSKSHAEQRIQMGDRITRGLGAGADPEVGEKAAEEDRETIKEHLSDTDLVFITAGMGGGTGTGSAPVVAEIAREMGILTIAIVTRPFRFEGPKRLRVAEEGIKKLSERVDGMIIVNNEKLIQATDKKVSLKDAFLIADRVLYFGIKGISDVINSSGMINVDFADVKNQLKDAGSVLMGIGAGHGDNLIEEAVKSAIHSPLLERSIEGAKKILINITGHEDKVTLSDTYEIVNRITEATGFDQNTVEVLFGVAYDENAGDEIRVTVVASGFNETPGLGNFIRNGQQTSPLTQPFPNIPNPNNSPDIYEIPTFLRWQDKDGKR
jgi:cell division protein FtsZ